MIGIFNDVRSTIATSMTTTTTTTNTMIMRLTLLMTIVSSLMSRECAATVDPSNATTIDVDGLVFNVTHDYWRTRFLLDDKTLVSFWVNPYELPESMLLYDDNHWNLITKTETMHRLIVATTKRVFNDWNIGYKRMRFSDYYRQVAEENDYLAKRPLYPISGRSVSTNVVNTKRARFLRRSPPDTTPLKSLGYPLMVHFRYKPYPQSSFGEFVSNRAAEWRVWSNDEDYRASDYVGADDDLLYRMRHNIGHSMGLGHTSSERCIMHPTNVRYLSSMCDEELHAMRTLLTTPRVVYDGY